MLEVDHATKRYGTTVALDDVSLRVAPGEVVTLLGANGAGKTTLMTLIAGLRRPDGGRVRVGEGDPRVRPTRAMLGFAPQELGVYPRLTVAANLTVFAELAGRRGPSVAAGIEAAAADLGLTDLLNRRAGDLSGGERRRVHVAMALVHGPRLVVLDEPTAGVDVAARGSLLALVRALANRGAAVVYSTHYLAEAETLGGRVAILHRGRVVADSDIGSLVADLPGRVELEFVGPPPDLVLGGSMTVTRDGSHLTVATTSPERDAATVLGAASGHIERLRSVRVRSASLEDAYLRATGETLVEEVA